MKQQQQRQEQEHSSRALRWDVKSDNMLGVQSSRQRQAQEQEIPTQSQPAAANSDQCIPSTTHVHRSPFAAAAVCSHDTPMPDSHTRADLASLPATHCHFLLRLHVPPPGRIRRVNSRHQQQQQPPAPAEAPARSRPHPAPVRLQMRCTTSGWLMCQK